MNYEVQKILDEWKRLYGPVPEYPNSTERDRPLRLITALELALGYSDDLIPKVLKALKGEETPPRHVVDVKFNETPPRLVVDVKFNEGVKFNKEEGVRFGMCGKEMLSFDRENFFVRGVKVELGPDEAREVFDMFKEWMFLITTNRWEEPTKKVL